MNRTYGRIFCLIGLTILIISQCHTQWIRTNGVSGGGVNTMAVCGTDIYAGTAKVFHSTDNGNNWISIFPWSAMALAAVRTDSGKNVVFVCSIDIYWSSDNGLNWADRWSSPNEYYGQLAICGTTIYAAENVDWSGWHTFLTQDFGKSWNVAGFYREGTAKCLGVGLTWSGDTNLFAATTSGTYLSTNSELDWSFQDSTPFNTLKVKGTKVFGGNSHGAFYSSDNGITWFAVNDGLTDTIVNAFAVRGRNIFAGTNGGVFISTNSGTNWSAINTGLTDSIVYSLAINDSFLFAGTDSTGVWRRPLSEIIPKTICENPVSDGWNLISVPLKVNDYLKTALFPTAISDAFAYQESYLKKDTLAIGTGYWLRFVRNETVSTTGDFITPESIAVVQGWNLIGSFGDSVPVYMIGSNIPGMVTSNFFTYKNGYIVADSILPGNGYWVKADTSGYLIYRSEDVSPVTNRIHIVATQELPPSPPGEQENNLIPKQYALEQAYPSPFNPTTTIQYSLPSDSRVSLRVYNLLGQVVTTLVNQTEPAGYKSVNWNASNFASGVYFYRLEAIGVANPGKTFSSVKKMVLMK